jgi:hypothetical protein
MQESGLGQTLRSLKLGSAMQQRTRRRVTMTSKCESRLYRSPEALSPTHQRKFPVRHKMTPARKVTCITACQTPSCPRLFDRQIRFSRSDPNLVGKGSNRYSLRLSLLQSKLEIAPNPSPSSPPVKLTQIPIKKTEREIAFVGSTGMCIMSLPHMLQHLEYMGSQNIQHCHTQHHQHTPNKRQPSPTHRIPCSTAHIPSASRTPRRLLRPATTPPRRRGLHTTQRSRILKSNKLPRNRRSGVTRRKDKTEAHEFSIGFDRE